MLKECIFPTHNYSQRFRNLHLITFSDKIRLQPLTLLYLLVASSDLAMEIQSKLSIQHTNTKSSFPLKIACVLLSVSRVFG